MEKKDGKNALWELFVKTGLPEVYSLYRSEEKKVGGRDQDAGDMPQNDGIR